MSEFLREKFEKEEFLHWENDDGEPDIDYVEWLEKLVEKTMYSTEKDKDPICVNEGCQYNAVRINRGCSNVLLRFEKKSSCINFKKE